MSEYRCGLTDAAFARSMVAKWGKKKLTWHIDAALPALGVARQANILSEAFASWSKVTDLTFTPTDNPRSADIVIGYGRGRRADFDGRGGTLAWAMLPSSEAFDGQLQLMFDMDEDWENTIRTVNVACHEIGHTLGLSHGPEGCLMAPVYAANIATPQRWDIDEAVSRYGVPTTAIPPPTLDGDRVIVRVGGVLYEGQLRPYNGKVAALTAPPAKITTHWGIGST